MRPIKSKGGYENGEHYLDVQFRLLREDMVAPLRGGICEVIDEVPRSNRKYGLKVYYGVQVIYPLCTKNGMIHRICFDTETTKGVPWKQSRRLIFGSLLCFSKDQFRTMIFATVADRDPDQLAMGLLDVRFVGGLGIQNYFRNREVMQMVESSAYFEAYKHVLEGMKECDPESIPMQQYIVHCNAEVESPSYLRRRYNPTFNLSEALSTQMGIAAAVDILDDESWPSYQETELNESQLRALKHALTKEFVVIQGPPGTGKTHVGLRIAHALLENKEFWNRNQRSPMLVVCYTNHALDQFLAGLIQFGHENIIRVGGRANEEMKEYSLFNALIAHKENEQVDVFKYIRRAKAASLQEREIRMIRIQRFTEIMIDAYRKLITGTFVRFSSLQYYMTEEHAMYLGPYDQMCRLLKMSIFDIFLELYPVSLQDLANVQLVKYKGNELDQGTISNQNIKKIATVDIDGEGETLVDRWVADAKEYEVVEDKSLKNQNEEMKKEKILERNDGFQYVLPKPIQKWNKIKKCMREYGIMSKEQVATVHNPWDLPLPDRWRLYRYWINVQFVASENMYLAEARQYENVCEQIREIQQQEDEIAMKRADVIAMTTTCAALYRNILEKIQPKVVIIEEAAEVLEAHVLTSLSKGIEHLILIGDHKQLKPNPEVFDLATKYNLELSLFQRMVNNGMECHTLEIQHRMRPEISKLLRHIYPNLQDHHSVMNYPNIMGVSRNIMFINHHEKEISSEHTKSKSNIHEAQFIKGLCMYFLQQGYKPSQITVLTGYTGQLLQLKNIMPKSDFEGVRITAVDNYQGEENDIILLSLVRSNSDGSIGFLRTENRICVALSRAKHGLFVIGNFDMLEEKSSMWKKIVSDIKQMGCFGKSVQLHCQNHPSVTFSAKTGGDFSQAPEGGCTKPCEFRLDCGHVCEKACHPKDPEHLEYECRKTCNKFTCDTEHRCNKQCHLGRICGPCITKVERLIQACKHIQIMPCHQNPEEFDCKYNVDKLLPCSHTQTVACFKPPEDVTCATRCGAEYPCGHKCMKKCHYLSDCGKCEEKVKKRMPNCDHLQSVPCYKNPEDFSCLEKCCRVLTCKHACTKRCGELCDPLECTVSIRKVMPGCGHRLMIDCNRQHIPCLRKCDRLLWCGHKCNRSCGEDCNLSKCNVEIEKEMPTCGHKQTLACSQDVNEYSCNMMCERMLSCGHPCKVSCGTDCTENVCIEGIEKILPCGHHQVVRCYEEVTTAVCSTDCNTELDCGHVCIGTCSECKQGCLHKPCVAKCRRVLLCSHLCEDPCIKECSPCPKQCENRCSHAKCTRTCSEQCIPCVKECIWQCKHRRCTRRCSEICDREPCNEPCMKLLKCQHLCVGVCGEVCPEVCRICDKETLPGKESDRFIVLEDCNHIFEVNEFDAYMKTGIANELKECPKCKTVIRKSLRYGNILKNVMAHIKEIQRPKSETENTIARIYYICRDINRTIDEIRISSRFSKFRNEKVSPLLKISNSLSKFSENFNQESFDGLARTPRNFVTEIAVMLSTTSLTQVAAEKLLRQLILLNDLWELKKGIINVSSFSQNDIASILDSRQMIDLTSVISSHYISDQDLNEVYLGIQRMQLVVDVKITIKFLKETRINQRSLHIVEKYSDDIEEGKKMGKILIDMIMHEIKTLGIRYYIPLVSLQHI